MYERERETALEAVVTAVDLCRHVSGTCLGDSAMAKQDRSPVTIADFGAQALILGMLSREFPDDALVAEETSAELQTPEGQRLAERVLAAVQRTAPGISAGDLVAAIDRGVGAGGRRGRFWVLDPIDGTKGFLRGGQYAVALALVEDGEVRLGVLGCPNLGAAGETGRGTGRLFYAVRGEGAFVLALDGADAMPTRVSTRRAAADVVLCESVESGHTAQGRSEAVAHTLGVTRPPVRIDSQCKYVVVARGEADVYLRLPTRADYEERIWDHAAGWLITVESGGRVTDVEGRELDFTQGRTLAANRGIVATNGLVHDAVLEALGQNRS